MSDYLIHYGVLGMKWGVRKQRPTSGNTRSRRTGSDQRKGSNSRASTAKKIAIGAAIVGGTVLVGYGAYKISKLPAVKNASAKKALRRYSLSPMYDGEAPRMINFNKPSKGEIRRRTLYTDANVKNRSRVGLRYNSPYAEPITNKYIAEGNYNRGLEKYRSNMKKSNAKALKSVQNYRFRKTIIPSSDGYRQEVIGIKTGGKKSFIDDTNYNLYSRARTDGVLRRTAHDFGDVDVRRPPKEPSSPIVGVNTKRKRRG